MNKIGQKLYRFNEDNELEVVRVFNLHKDGDTTILINNGKNKRKVSPDYLKDFVLLREDGVIVFNIVTLGEEGSKSRDVIIMLYRRDGMNMEKVPFAACRQCIFDSFASINTDVMYMGLSLNQNNVPDNIPFKSMIACNGVEYFEHISIYNDDKLDDILSMIKDRKRFDTVLKDIYVANNKSEDPRKPAGFSRSLKGLIEENGFMYDYRDTFDIRQVDFVVDYDEESLELNLNQVKELEYIYKIEMLRSYVVPYTKEIDLKKIERSHVIIADKNENIFIVAYDKGDYINDYAKKNLKDKMNIVRMIKQAMK